MSTCYRLGMGSPVQKVETREQPDLRGPKSCGKVYFRPWHISCYRSFDKSVELLIEDDLLFGADADIIRHGVSTNTTLLRPSNCSVGAAPSACFLVNPERTQTSPFSSFFRLESALTPHARPWRIKG